MCLSCCKVSICINIVKFTALLLLLLQFLAFPSRYLTHLYILPHLHIVIQHIARASPFVCRVSNSFTHLISTIVAVVVAVAVFTHLHFTKHIFGPFHLNAKYCLLNFCYVRAQHATPRYANLLLLNAVTLLGCN